MAIRLVDAILRCDWFEQQMEILSPIRESNTAPLAQLFWHPMQMQQNRKYCIKSEKDNDNASQSISKSKWSWKIAHKCQRNRAGRIDWVAKCPFDDDLYQFDRLNLRKQTGKCVCVVVDWFNRQHAKGQYQHNWQRIEDCFVGFACYLRGVIDVSFT